MTRYFRIALNILVLPLNITAAILAVTLGYITFKRNPEQYGEIGSFKDYMTSDMVVGWLSEEINPLIIRKK